MITIPHRSSDCQIAISTDNSQVTKRCHGTKTTDGKIEWVHMICDVGHLCSRVNTSTYLYIEYSGNVRSVTAKLHIITIAGYWRDLVRATAMITRILKTNAKKARIKFRGRKNLVANESEPRIWCWTSLERSAIRHAWEGNRLEFCAAMVLS